MVICSFIIESITPSKPTISVQQAIATVETAIGGKYNDLPPTVEFFVKPDNSVVLTHVVQIRDEATGIWVEAFVSAHANEPFSLVDFVTKASVSLHMHQRDCLHTKIDTTYIHSISFSLSRRRFSLRDSRL